jgi:hypothetical protein
VDVNLIEAIKSGKRYRRQAWENGNGQWRGPANFSQGWHEPVCETLCDFVADDWEIQETSVTITRTQFLEAFREALIGVEHRHGIKVNYFGLKPPANLWESDVVRDMGIKLGLLE